MQKYVYTRPEDGGVSIITFANNFIAKDIPINAINVRPIQDSELPKDIRLRNAWVDVPGKGIVVDPAKAALL